MTRVLGISTRSADINLDRIRQNGDSNDKWNAIDLRLEQISFDFYNFFLKLSRKTENCAIDDFWVGFPGRKYRWERKGIPRSISAK